MKLPGAVVAVVASLLLLCCGGTVQGRGGFDDRAADGAASGGRNGMSGGVSRGGVSSTGGSGLVHASGGMHSIPDAGPPAATDASRDVATSHTDPGTFVDAGTPVRGHYDVWFDDPKVPGCEIAIGTLRLNLYVEVERGAISVSYFKDYTWAEAQPTIEPGLLRVVPMSRPDDWERRPSLALERSPSAPYGFTGTGTAAIPLLCGTEQAIFLDAPVRVVPDATPPTIRMSPATASPWVLPFTWFRLESSEPIAPSNASEPWAFADIAQIQGYVGLVDATSGGRIAFALRTWPESPSLGLTMTDRDAVVGRSVRLAVSNELRDGAGNVALADETAFEVHDAGPVSTKIDFEDGPQRGLLGTATYHAPGEPGSPCESGGCVTIDSTVGECQPYVGRVPGAVASRLAVPSGSEIKFRYRILAEQDVLQVFAFAEEDVSCILTGSSQLHLLRAPLDGFAYGTDWTEELTSSPSCTRVDVDGLVILPPCAFIAPAQRLRIVIEWVGTAPPSSDAGTVQPPPP